MIYKLIVAAAALAASLPSICLSTPISMGADVDTKLQDVQNMAKLLKRATGSSIISTCTVPNSVAVTFDDGPSDWTPGLLDYLATKKVKVTFFVNGNNYGLITDPKYAAIVKRAYNEGHQIASHTWSHADLSSSSTDVKGEMEKLDRALLKIIKFRPVYMRPPYGNTSPRSLKLLTDNGYKVILWDIDTEDWRHPTDYKASMQHYIDALEDGPSGKGFISLQHDTVKGTAQELAKLAIDYILEKGFKIMPVGACLGDTKGWYRK